MSRNTVFVLFVGAAIGFGTHAIIRPSVLIAAPQSGTKAGGGGSSGGSAQFGVTVAPADDTGRVNGVFIVDQLQGHVAGGVLDNRTGKYRHRYFRRINADFGIPDSGPTPVYTVIASRADINLRNGLGKGVLHIAEKHTGRVIAYAFAFPNNANPNTPLPLFPLDTMQFSER